MSEEIDVNVIALIKGRERYVFLYDDESCQEVLLFFGKFASSPKLSFTWYDAAALSEKVREMHYKHLILERNEFVE